MSGISNVMLRPALGRAHAANKAGRFLLVCFYDPNGISTVWENINLLKSNSCFEFNVLNLWPGRSGSIRIPQSVDLKAFDGVYIHPTACYSVVNLKSLDSELETRFRDYEGIKIIAKQDEHYLTSQFDQHIAACGFDMVLSCVPKVELGKAYPLCAKAGVTFVETLTGYVSDHMQAIGRPRYGDRPIDISYRGSLQPVSFGRLGFEKWFIGAQVDTHPATAGLVKDISSQWKDRVNGNDWYRFLGRSKAVLGVESGSNLFDFDGSAHADCEALTRGRSETEIYTEAFYQTLAEGVLKGKEGNVNYAQISPRHFEACAAGALQVMYEGRYSDIFQPNRHFFPLKRDLSNLHEAVELVQDEVAWRQMTETAYNEIIATDRYTYSAFVVTFDEVLYKVMQQRGKRRSGVSAKGPAGARDIRVLNLFAHEPVIDPRIDWHSASLEGPHVVCELGSYGFKIIGTKPTVTAVNPRRLRVQVARQVHGHVWRELNPVDLGSPSVYRNVMHLLRTCLELDDARLRDLIGAHDAQPADFVRFRSLCKYMLDTNSALFEAGRDIGPFEVIICADLESLPAAIGLKEIWGCRVAFDSHEFWPFSYIDFRHWENDFWSRVEHALVQSTDVRMTVSTPLAATLSSEYGLPFHVLPNACRMAEAVSGTVVEEARARRADKATVDFLFQGNFAPGRGLEHLVAHWEYAPERARLLLRGPDNIYRQELLAQADRLGLLGKSIVFLDAVPEHQLIEAALMADVGIIPYDPSNYGYRFACPNKLSQYMAAGMPIFTNEIEYVVSVVEQGDCGVCARFDDRDAFLTGLIKLTDGTDERGRLGRNARAFFETSYHWEALSPPVYSETFAGLEAVGTLPDPETLCFSRTLSLIQNTMSEAVERVAPEQFMISGDEERLSGGGKNWLYSMPLAPARLVWRTLPMGMRQAISRLLPLR